MSGTDQGFELGTAQVLAGWAGGVGLPDLDGNGDTDAVTANRPGDVSVLVNPR